MQVTAYLNFDGNCEAALKFYERVLGGKIECLIRYAGTPAERHSPAEYRDKVLHARLNIAGHTIMASDCGDQYKSPQGFAITLGVKDAAEAERVFGDLADGGEVCMPVQETFWAVRFGMLTDRFGTPWMINCEKAMDIPNGAKEEHAYAGAR